MFLMNAFIEKLRLIIKKGECLYVFDKSNYQKGRKPELFGN